MATGYAGSTLVAELNRLANAGTYPDRAVFLEEAGAANAWLNTNWHPTIHTATTVGTSGTYAAGTTGADGGTGVGATITAPANGTITVDGHLMSVGERILYWKNSDAKYNGIYVVTNAGSAGTRWVITRATDADNGTRAAEISIGNWIGPVTQGSANVGKYFRMNATGTGVNGSIVIGTDNITYEEISAPTFPVKYQTVGALNLKADPLRTEDKYKGLNAICNELAGTTNKSAVSALRSIDL
jgi:hypothetical protein